MSSRRIQAGFIVFVMLIWVGRVSAREYFQADRCVIAEDETVTGTVFVLCQELIIDGVIDGNLMGAATNVTINGQVHDSVYLIGGQLDLYGTVGDDLHYLGIVLNIHEGTVFRNRVADLFSITMTTEIDSDTSLSGTILAAGYQLLIHGNVGREVSFWGAALEVDGEIGGDLLASVGDPDDIEGTAQLETLFIPFPVDLELVDPGLRVAEGSMIHGDLRYDAPSVGEVNGTVAGETIFELVSVQFEPPTDEASLRKSVQEYFGASFREFLTLGVVGALGLMFAPGLTQAPIRNLRRRPLTSLGVGTLTFILSFPVFAIALLISGAVIFILSLLQVGNLIFAGIVALLILDVGGASLFYFVAIFVARSVFCLAIGRRLMRFVFEDDGSMRFLYVGLMAGSFLIGFAVSLPVIGWIFNAFALFLGLGAIVNLLQAQLRNLREGRYFEEQGEQPANGARWQNRYISVEPPPLPSERSSRDEPPRPKHPRPRHTVGLDDLPPGFVWWDEL